MVVTLGFLFPLTAGDYDLSIGGVLSLCGMVVAVLNVHHGWPVGLACVVAVALGVCIGMANGAITVFFEIDPFIVTLGVGTLASGVTLWISGSATVSGVSNSLISAVVETRVFGIPIRVLLRSRAVRARMGDIRIHAGWPPAALRRAGSCRSALRAVYM